MIDTYIQTVKRNYSSLAEFLWWVKGKQFVVQSRKSTVPWPSFISRDCYHRLRHYAQHQMCNRGNLGTVAVRPASNFQDLRCHARASAGNNGIKSAVDPADLLIPGLTHIKRPKEDHRAGGNNSEATEANAKNKKMKMGARNKAAVLWAEGATSAEQEFSRAFTAAERRPFRPRPLDCRCHYVTPFLPLRGPLGHSDGGSPTQRWEAFLPQLVVCFFFLYLWRQPCYRLYHGDAMASCVTPFQLLSKCGSVSDTG